MIKLMGGVREMAGAMFSDEESEGRSLQLPATFVVRPDMTVKYAYYGKTVDDVPELLKLIVRKN